MCVTYPGQVVDLADAIAVVKSDEHTWRASTVLVPETAVGDWVIVAAGAVLRVLDADEAREIRAMLEEARGDAPLPTHRVAQAVTADQEQDVTADQEQERTRR